MGERMTQQLFRGEVLAAQRAGWLGGISLLQPPGMWVLTTAACVAALAISLYLVLGSYTRRSTVTGQLVPAQGLATVLAPASGVVGAMQVAEGGRINAGETLTVIDVPRVTIAGGPSALAMEDSLRGRKEGLQSTQQGQLRALAAQATGFTGQFTAARGELAQINAEIATRQRQIRIGEETLARMRELHDRQYVSLVQLRQQESAVLDQLAAVQALQRQAGAVERDIQQLQQARDQLPGQRQAIEAGMQRDLAALAQEQVEMNAQRAVVITAPVAGLVATQLVQSGQAVQQGQPLLTMLPGDGALEAQLLVPSRAIGFIAPGDRVLLRYQAYPWQKFGHQHGQVTRISRSALGPEDLGALPGMASSQPLYRVTVALAHQAVMAYGRAEALKPGMLLDADILGERRRLVEWLFEPLYSIKGRFVSSRPAIDSPDTFPDIPGPVAPGLRHSTEKET